MCGEDGQPLNPLVADEFYQGVSVHLHCLNSPAGRARHDAQCAADPQYARYSMLITVGLSVPCSSCGVAGRLSPKGYGMGAGHWAENCGSCHRHRSGLNAYRSPAEADLVRRLQLLCQQFKVGNDVGGVLEELAGLELPAPSAGPDEACACGGTYSLAAPPRCQQCSGVLLDSPFHVTLQT